MILLCWDHYLLPIKIKYLFWWYGKLLDIKEANVRDVYVSCIGFLLLAYSKHSFIAHYQLRNYSQNGKPILPVYSIICRIYCRLIYLLTDFRFLVVVLASIVLEQQGSFDVRSITSLFQYQYVELRMCTESGICMEKGFNYTSKHWAL